MTEAKIISKVYANSGNQEILRCVGSAPSNILDVGCGAGSNARHLKESGQIVDGITISQAEANEASKYCRKVYLHNLEKGLPVEVKQRTYDCVICSHVLEHICFPGNLLNDIKECLKPNGKLIVALPNLMFISSRFRILLGGFEYQDSGLMDNTHFRWYTFKSSADLLVGNGYCLEKHYATGFIPLGFIRKLLPNFSSKLDFSLCKLWPGLFGYQIILVTRKAANR